MKIIGMLILTKDLLAFCWLERNTGIVNVMPLDRLTEMSLEGMSLVVIAGHPTYDGRYLGSCHELLDSPKLEDRFVSQRLGFLEALASSLRTRPPTRDELWPAGGLQGRSASWVPAMTDQELQKVLGHYRLVPTAAPAD